MDVWWDIQIHIAQMMLRIGRKRHALGTSPLLCQRVKVIRAVCVLAHTETADVLILDEQIE